MRKYSIEDIKTIRYLLGGISQRELGEILGVSKQLIQKIEAGERSITDRINHKIETHVVDRFIDRETLYKMLDGELPLPK